MELASPRLCWMSCLYKKCQNYSKNTTTTKITIRHGAGNLNVFQSRNSAICWRSRWTTLSKSPSFTAGGKWETCSCKQTNYSVQIKAICLFPGVLHLNNSFFLLPILLKGTSVVVMGGTQALLFHFPNPDLFDPCGLTTVFSTETTLSSWYAAALVIIISVYFPETCTWVCRKRIRRFKVVYSDRGGDMRHFY